MKAVIFLWSFILTPLLSAYAQKAIKFSHIAVEDGLSQSSVLSITQDSKGFLWFGTRYGLNKYNAIHFKTYKTQGKNKSNLTSSDYIKVLYADKNQNLWIGTGAGLNKYLPANDSFIGFTNDKNKAHSISHNNINCIISDKQGRTWIGTNNGLNLLKDTINHQFISFLKSKQEDNGGIYSLLEDHGGNLWAGTSIGLIQYAYINHSFKYTVHETLKPYLDSGNDNQITTLVDDKNGNLWIGTKLSGLIKYHLKSKSVTLFNAKNSGILSNNIRKIIIDRQQKLWIGTLNGLNILNLSTETITGYKHNPDNKYSLSQNSIYDIYEDKHGSIWIGTYYGGINVVHPNFDNFNIYQSSTIYPSLSSNVISAIIEDDKKNLWIGTEAQGLNYFNLKTQTFTVFKNELNDPFSLSSNLVKSLFKDAKGNIWVGTNQGGLNKLNPLTGKFSSFKYNKNDKKSIASNNVNFIFEDSYQRFWVGTNKGLQRFNGTNQFDFFNTDRRLIDNIINYIYEDNERNVWFGTVNGLFVLAKGKNQFKAYHSKLSSKTHLQSDLITFITQDKNKRLWVGTYHGGLSLFNPKTGSFTTFTEENGLPSNDILGLLEDKKGKFWISTNNGLCHFDGQKAIKIYDVKDGLPGNEFNNNSFYKDAEGTFYFGSYKGLISFSPAQLSVNTYPPTVVLTGLKLFNKPVSINDENGILSTDINVTTDIEFTYDQNIFSIDFAVLNYIHAHTNEFAYKLVGFEENWNYVNVPTATYTNLPAGKYTLLVKGANNDGIWSEEPAKLTITVLPPFWKTWWAYLIYLVVLGLVFFVFVRYLIIKALLKKEHEIHQIQLNFFTNISHEIRTPLSLIIGPIEQLLSSTKDGVAMRNKLLPIKKNADRLMRLITELLDFRKVEAGKMALQVSEQNLVKFTATVFHSFYEMAASKGIQFEFNSTAEEIPVYFDGNQLEKVLFNLISNALKFTPSGGKVAVYVTQNKSEALIKVIDNGKGIPEEKQQQLFTVFYQANDANFNGYGIGLALAKNIVELHKGSIEVESRPENNDAPGYTCFTVSLKRGNTHFDTTVLKPSNNLDKASFKIEDTTAIEPTVEHSGSEKKYTVLLVEDNEEVRLFIKESLNDLYHVVESKDGVQGWETAITTIPDLIISDVMMPNMDGLTLCKQLKLDERTSHIPVILLTAKADHTHQIAGLETGADIYVVKPFSMQMLALHVNNLLALKQAMRNKFCQSISLEPSNIMADSPNQKFMDKVIRLIEEHLSDAEFDIPWLSTELGMSQPVLYKKIRALTGLSVNDFIKTIRLKRAAQLLEQKIYTVYEVAYAVGFSDPKYFTKEFKKQYQQTPTAYANK